MESQKTLYAVLRDRHHWDGVTLAGLQPETDGVLTLARVPYPADGRPIIVPDPFDAEPSGIAGGPRCDTCLSDTAAHRVIWIDGMCKARMALPGCGNPGNGPGQLNQPRGLLITADDLYVADSGNGRIQVFRLPTLELRAIWEGLLHDPTGLAADSQGQVYVLDRGLKRVLRFSAAGKPDSAYNTSMSQHSHLSSPAYLAIDGKDTLYVLDVTDDQAHLVFRFDPDGKALGVLPTADAPALPRAMAAQGDRVYVSDADSGQIYLFDSAADPGFYTGVLPGYRGPVSAMATDEAGSLHIKPGLDETCHLLLADAGYVASGSLRTGPLDAGEGSEWERVHVQVDLPPGTGAELRLFTADAPEHAPSASDWAAPKTLAPALDTLVSPSPGPKDGQPHLKRYLWLRVLLKTNDPRTSPRLMQVQAETTGESYLNYLPAVYRREDAPRRFLERWLALFRSELGDRELTLEDIARRFDPATAPEDHLPWLATWLAFELPPDKDAEEWRRLLLRAYQLYDRRGTPAGIRDFVELYTGVRPHLFEAFRDEHVWQLGHTSALGFDTALASAAPEGMIVPGLTPPDPNYMGLRGDYYAGIHFDTLKWTHTDPVDFEWGVESPDPQLEPDNFSVRWTGQVQARHSETYTFYTLSDDGVRLWVGGRLIIDNWTDHAPTEDIGRFALTAGRWYPITVEYYEKGGAATMKLSWSSRSQPKEIIPQDRLYSVMDEGASLGAPSQESGAETVLVGQTVVGQSGPLAASEFGMPLFSDTAHLFTVVVPAARFPTAAKRQALRDVLEAEKPAHTDFHLCFVEARMRVGFQARLGIDSIVASGPPPLVLDTAHLGVTSTLDGGPSGSRLGHGVVLGRDTYVS